MSQEAAPENYNDAFVRGQMQDIAQHVKASIPNGWGFAVIVFPMDGEAGRLNYVSNAKREPLCKLLANFIRASGQDFGNHSTLNDPV